MKKITLTPSNPTRVKCLSIILSILVVGEILMQIFIL